MLRKVNSMKELKDVLYDALRNNAQSIGVEMTIPGQKNTEFVINNNKSIKSKIYYYERTYNDDLVNKKIDSIRIVSAGYGDADLWDEDEENK